MWPGLMLQNLTTREPDRDELAVAIAALEAVLAVENPEQAARRARSRSSPSCIAATAEASRAAGGNRFPKARNGAFRTVWV